MTTPLINSYGQTPVQGQVDELGFGTNVLPVIVSNSASGALMPLVPGQAVKVANETTGIPSVLPLAANTDATNGFIVYNIKDISYAADARAEMAFNGTVMYMTSGAAISRWGQVEVVYNASGGGTVIASAGVNPVVGFAFDKATAAGQLIRVYIEDAASVATTIASVSGLQAALNAVQPHLTITNLTTVGAGTITAAGIVGGVTNRTGSTSAFTDTTDTAAAIISEIATLTTGSPFIWYYYNNTGFAATLAAGATVTFAGTSGIVPAGTWLAMVVNPTSASAVTMTGIATGSIGALPPSKFTTGTTATTFTAGELTGADFTVYTNTATTPGSIATRTATLMIGDLPNAYIGQTWITRVINQGTSPLTITAGTDVTLTGAAVVPVNGYLDFACSITSIASHTITMQNISQSLARPPVTVGASKTLVAAQTGTTFLLGTASGSVATLPAATGTGAKFRFVVTTTVTSNSHKIITASSSDYIQGYAIGENSNTAKIFTAAPAATYCSIQMPAAGSTPSGGYIGDQFDFEDIASATWQCTAVYQAGTTPTTPFSTATS